MTELLSNVHRHAAPDKSCTVELELKFDRLTVSVRDRDPRLPQLRSADPLETSGRGLALLEAVSESWGVRPLAADEAPDGRAGKVVWFTLPVAVAAPPPLRPVSILHPDTELTPVTRSEVRRAAVLAPS